MVLLKNYHIPDETIRAARSAEIGSYATHETSMTSFLKFYENIGIITSDILSSPAYRKLTDFHNAHS